MEASPAFDHARYLDTLAENFRFIPFDTLVLVDIIFYWTRPFRVRGSLDVDFHD